MLLALLLFVHLLNLLFHATNRLVKPVRVLAHPLDFNGPKRLAGVLCGLAQGLETPGPHQVRQVISRPRSISSVRFRPSTNLISATRAPLDSPQAPNPTADFFAQNAKPLRDSKSSRRLSLKCRSAVYKIAAESPENNCISSFTEVKMIIINPDFHNQFHKWKLAS